MDNHPPTFFIVTFPMANAYAPRTTVDHRELPADHWSIVTKLPYFYYVQRPEAEEKIKNTENQYILRLSNDPIDSVEGRPNQNVFVISFTVGPVHAAPGTEESRFRHTKVLRVPGHGFCFGNQYHPSKRLYPTITELLNASDLHGLRPCYPI